jgi:FMN-dependent NADH-azoreductase
MQVLYLSCSPRGTASFSSLMAQDVIGRIRERHDAVRIVTRELGEAPPAIVDAGFSAAILSPPEPGKPALAISETLILELEASDALVIATPMHNYGVPAVLKAWIDQIVRIHRTFRSTPAGKVGILTDRPVYVVISSGGWFTRASPTGAPPQPDFLRPYLQAVFSTIGITDLHFLTLEGVTRGPEIVQRAFAEAQEVLNTALPA